MESPFLSAVDSFLGVGSFCVMAVAPFLVEGVEVYPVLFHDAFHLTPSLHVGFREGRGGAACAFSFPFRTHFPCVGIGSRALFHVPFSPVHFFSFL